MYRDQPIWHVWAAALQRRGMKEWASTFLDAAGPFTTLAAQILYIGEPWIKHALPGGYLDALLNLLEDPAQAHAFASYLRESSEPG